MRRALARREQSNPAAARSQMLTMRVVGACGMPYYGVSLKDKPFDTYRCTGNRHGRDKCGCKQVQVQDLDERVWSVVSEFLSDPKRLEAAARAWLELPDESDEGSAEVVAGIDKRIKELERGQANAARELLLSDTPDLLRAALADIGRELATLKERRAGYEAFRAQATAKAQQISDLAALANRARHNLAAMPPEARREVCEILGIRVQLSGGIVSGKDRVARPEGLVVTGSIDPRLSFGEDGGAADGGSGGGSGPDNPESDGRTPGSSSGRHLVARPAPDNSVKSAHVCVRLPAALRVLAECGLFLWLRERRGGALGQLRLVRQLVVLELETPENSRASVGRSHDPHRRRRALDHRAREGEEAHDRQGDAPVLVAHDSDDGTARVHCLEKAVTYEVTDLHGVGRDVIGGEHGVTAWRGGIDPFVLSNQLGEALQNMVEQFDGLMIRLGDGQIRGAPRHVATIATPRTTVSKGGAAYSL
ncbi:recombinase zinc beta ribbon domain-containing protein [Microbacterium aurum]